MSAFEMQVIRENIDAPDVAEYLTAEWGNDLALWRDGTVQIVESSAVWRNDDSPIARAQCPGIGNLDSHAFTEDFVKYDTAAGAYITTEPQPDPGRIVGDLEAVIRECCRDGDVEAFREDLIAALAASVEEAMA